MAMDKIEQPDALLHALGAALRTLPRRGTVA